MIVKMTESLDAIFFVMFPLDLAIDFIIFRSLILEGRYDRTLKGYSRKYCGLILYPQLIVGGVVTPAG